jgi:glyoxylase-like metal-dependent hydrolase (beta-lactamase superfamily II)
MSELPYDVVRQVTPSAAVVLAANPGLMTLEGTNTWLLRDSAQRREAIVVDPGPLDENHLQVVAREAGAVREILLTHGHSDHSDGARRLHEITGAPVRALDPTHRYGSEGLAEGQVIAASGVELRVWATPGHSSDSMCFLLGDKGSAAGMVLTGDTILGRGTTVVAHPDGTLGPYLASLERLALLGPMTVLPGHGPELADAGGVAKHYLAHRAQRLAQVAAVRERFGADVSAMAVVEIVYADVDQALWPAAERSVKAQLDYLAQEA